MCTDQDMLLMWGRGVESKWEMLLVGPGVCVCVWVSGWCMWVKHRNTFERSKEPPRTQPSGRCRRERKWRRGMACAVPVLRY